MNFIKVSQKGFTLVEIMIVVSIIGLLAAVAIPAFNKVRENSQATTCANNLRQIVSAKDQYFLEHGGEPNVALEGLIDPDGYIKAMPVCPSRGDYTNPLTPNDEPLCSSGEPQHKLS